MNKTTRVIKVFRKLLPISARQKNAALRMSSFWLFVLSVLLLIFCSIRAAHGNEKAVKSFVLKGLISDLEDQSIHFSNPEDLTRVAQSYELLGKSYEEIRAMNTKLAKIFRDQELIACSHIILGAGDTGTTVWLEKYKPYHGKTQEEIQQGHCPDVLMIGETHGCWSHDYTLAQPYGLLDRGTAFSNPSDYLFQGYYRANPYANARHVYQANLVNLAKTQAPHLAGMKVLRIEKKSSHLEDWESKTHEYRLVVSIPAEEKAVYANEIDVCTGLGPARETIASKCDSLEEFETLSQFDKQKLFTPIVSGDQFMLTDSEEKSSDSRVIVVYGGGGTAAACYRKGFFGHDRQKEFNSFENQNNQNNVLWIAKDGFSAAGGGRLATKALETAKKKSRLFSGELSKIVSSKGRLKLSFTQGRQDAEAASISEIECDQLVYSIGQENVNLKQACKEFDSELQLDVNQTGMPICVKTSDEKIHFFGTAAMAIRQMDYMSSTWNWLHKENIGPDVGPGSMPPSRAQIKGYISTLGIPVECVNVNMDSIHLVQKLLEYSGIEEEKASFFIEDVLQARKESTAGFTTWRLQGLLDKHHLNDKVHVLGLSHLVRK
jgi:hypothetical protein